MHQFLLGMLLLMPAFLFSQTSARELINAERRYQSYEDEKTFQKAKGWIRADTTYYVGYMYQGAFSFYRANDEHGFSQTIVPLEKAMQLIESEFDKELRTRTNDIFTYIRVSTLQNDYCEIAYWLQQSYQNIENPAKAFEVVSHVNERKLQMEQGIESYNTMGWIFHRNRVYSPKDGPQYAFLKNSVQDNDSMAYKYLDSALLKHRIDAELNLGLFDASYLNRQYLYTYHYKAILFDYNLEIDSANLYYDELIRTGYYSSNNYAEFKLAMGDFQTSYQYFLEAEQRDGAREKQTREYYYMRGTLDTYRGRPDQADTLLRKIVNEQVASPGYGWHSIALARALHYEGLTAESQDRINSANKFHELHISTTWGPEQYKTAVATLNYTNQVQYKEDYFFENDEWWFWLNPVHWGKYAKYSIGINNQKLILAAMVAENPERKQTIYPIFSSENLINFDEVWQVIDGFGNEYFIKIYKEQLEKDKRPLLKKYFRYFLAKLYLAEGKKAEAIDYFQQVLNDPEMDDEYQRLLFARCCEGMALASSNSTDKNYWTQQMYEAFPQLVPHSELTMRFHLDGDVQTSGKKRNIMLAWVFGIFGVLASLVLHYLRRSGNIRSNPVVVFLPLVFFFIISGSFLFWVYVVTEHTARQTIIDGLANCNIELTNDINVPVVEFQTKETPEATEITYVVRKAASSEEVTSGVLTVSADDTDDGGKLLAYRLFGIKKKKIGEEPEAVEVEDTKTKNGAKKE
ncbi:MAG: hypothetical protein M3R17_13990 [Bacteroidota bacterium]|nr:hypothetical protein [Bacteroidota bacterium]